MNVNFEYSSCALITRKVACKGSRVSMNFWLVDQKHLEMMVS